MGCVVKPENHLLWDELFLYLGQDNRKLVKYWYTVAHDQEFLELARDVLEFNSEGEPTFASLMRAAGTTEYQELIKAKLELEIGAGEMSYDEAIEKLQSFNRNTSFKQEFIATLTPSKNGKVILSISANTETNRSNLNEYIKKRSLQERILYYLKKAGVNYEFIENAPEGSRYSTEFAEKTADGLATLIKIAKGEKVTEDLAEEAGHFAIGALRNSPLVERLLGLLDTPTIKSILGDDYDNKYLGNNPKREVAGYLVGQAILNNSDNSSALGRLANRIVAIAKRVFATLTYDTVKLARMEAENIAKNIAKSFMSEDFEGTLENAMSISETLYNRQKTEVEKVYDSVAAEIIGLIKKYKKYYPLKAEVLESIIMLMENDASWTDTFYQESAINGIGKALYLLAEEVKSIQTAFESIDKDFSDDIKFWKNFYLNGKSIRQCEDFCIAVNNIVTLLNNATSNSAARDKQINKHAVATIAMGDSVWQENLLVLSQKLSDLVNGRVVETPSAEPTVSESLLANVKQLKGDFFVKFCEKVYGRKYITRAKRVVLSGFGWKATKILHDFKESIADLVDYLPGDTTIIGRLFTSLDTSSDVISQIIFKAYKAAQTKANWEVMQVQDDIRDLIKQAVKNNVFDHRLYCAKTEWDTDIEEFKKLMTIGTGDRKPIALGNDEYQITFFNEKGELQTTTFHYKFPDPPKKGSLTGDITSLYNEAYYEWLYRQFCNFKKALFKAMYPGLNPNGTLFALLYSEFFKNEREDFYKKTHHKNQATNTWELNSEYISEDYVKNILGINTSHPDWKRHAIRKLRDLDEDASTDNQAYKILEKWKTLKKKLDDKLPPGSTSYNRLPLFRGDFLERYKNKFNQGEGLFASGIKVSREKLKEAFISDASLGDFGSDATYNDDSIRLDEDPLYDMEERLGKVPIYGVNRLNDTSKLTTDIFGSLLAYADMACTYEQMDNIIHVLELGKSHMQENRKVFHSSSKYYRMKNEAANKQLSFSLNTFNTTNSKIFSQKEGANFNYYRSLVSFLDKNIYGIKYSGYINPGGNILKSLAKDAVYMGKALNNILKFLLVIAMGASLPVAAISFTDGIWAMLKESLGGKYITKRALVVAHGIYIGMLAHNLITSMGFRFSHTSMRADKLSLILRHFNIDDLNKLRYKNWKTKKRLHSGKLVGDALYGLLNSSTVYMNTVPFIAMMMSTKIYDSNGKKVSLWKAYNRESTNWSRKHMHGSPFKSYTLKLTDDYFTSIENMKIHKAIEVERLYLDRMLQESYEQNITDEDFEEWLDNYVNLSASLEAIDYIVSRKNSDIINENGSWNIKSRKDLKDIIQTLDYQLNDLKWNERDEADFSTKSRIILDNMHGIYGSSQRGDIDRSIWGFVWAKLKGYVFGIVRDTFASNHYSIFHEDKTGRFLTDQYGNKILDEKGDPIEVIDGEFEGTSISGFKALRLFFPMEGTRSAAQYGEDLANLFLGSVLSSLPVHKVGKHSVDNIWESSGLLKQTGHNIRKLIAIHAISAFIRLLIDSLKKLGEDEDEEELEYENVWMNVKLTDIEADGEIRKAFSEVIKELRVMWDNGKHPEGNVALKILTLYPHVFKKDSDSLKALKHISNLYEKGKMRDAKDRSIDWYGMGVYVLERSLRDFNAFTLFTYDHKFVGDRDAPITQEISASGNVLLATMAGGVITNTINTVGSAIGAFRYSDLQQQKNGFELSAEGLLNDLILEYGEDVKKLDLKEAFSEEVLLLVFINKYELNPDPEYVFGNLYSRFKNYYDYVAFMADNKEEYPTKEKLELEILNKYFYKKRHRQYSPGDAKWESLVRKMLPWTRNYAFFYYPEEQLDTYLFAMRNR